HDQSGALIAFSRFHDVVAPETRLRLEVEFAAAEEIGLIGLFAVDVRREPNTGSHVLTPAIEVEVLLCRIRRAISAVEPHDGVVLLFHPDSAEEFSVACALLRLDIENETPHISEKLSPDGVEVIVF